MGDALLTRASLLARLADPGDRAAWQQFVELYGRLVYAFARKRGLQDADAADLTQEVFLGLADAAGRWRYDARLGSFRGWLYGITRKKIARFLERRNGQAQGSGDTDANRRFAEKPGREPGLEESWEREYQEQLFRLAAEEVAAAVAPKTWRAFWGTAVEGRPAAEVGAELGLSAGAVYVARSRVLARLTERVQELRAEAEG
jgi:RNA polymerase sigma-70 factor (ECF subfamily)